MDRGQPAYQTYKTSLPRHLIVIPAVVLVIVLAIVSGLVFGGVVQGHQERLGPPPAPTTEATVLIVP